MKKVVIAIVNGKPLSGKTTIQNMCHQKYRCVKIETRSSVDVMYKIYNMLGWDGIKDEQFRSDMHLLKQMYINNCDGPTRDIVKLAIDILNLDDDDYVDDVAVIFYDVREMGEIEKLKSIIKSFNCIGIYCKTVFVRRYDKENIKYGNESDDGFCRDAENDYDIVVTNDGTEDELLRKIPDFFYKLTGGKYDV